MVKLKHPEETCQGDEPGTSARAKALARRAFELQRVRALAERAPDDEVIRAFVDSAERLWRAADKGRDAGGEVAELTAAQERVRVQVMALRAAEWWARRQHDISAECLVYFCEIAEALRDAAFVDADRAYAFGVLDAIIHKWLGCPSVDARPDRWVGLASEMDTLHPLWLEWMLSFRHRESIEPDSVALARSLDRLANVSSRNKMTIVSSLTGISENTLKSAQKTRDPLILAGCQKYC